jgi:hypothetical protein
MQSLQRSLHNALATLLQIDPAQRIGVLLVILIFLVALNLASSVIYTALASHLLGNFLMVLSPLLTIALAIYWLANRVQPVRSLVDPRLTPSAGQTGMVWMLSIFSARIKLADGNTHSYQIEDLRRALDAPTPDRAQIEQMVEAQTSNLRPLLAAIHHHAGSGRLKHLWLISTDDLANPHGNDLLQPGSRHLVPLVERLLRDVYLMHDLAVHGDDPQLIVHPHQVADTYRAVRYIFQQDAPRLGVPTTELIADLTGGRVPMSCGMILACAPSDWALQFTSTDFDPATNTRSDQPVPVQIEVDLRTVLRQTLDATARQL